MQKAIDQNLSHFSNDLKLLRTISNRPEEPWQKPKNLQSLNKLLKYKNPPNLHNDEQLKKGQEWLAKKGIDLQPLISKIKKQKEIKAMQMQIQKPNDGYFYVNMSQKTLEEYLNKEQQYKSMNIVQYVMSRDCNKNRYIKDLISKNIKEEDYKVSWQAQAIPEQRRNYSSIIKSIVSKEKSYGNVLKEILNNLKFQNRNVQGQSLWEILAFQLQNYQDQKDVNENMVILAINSLKLVQKQFQHKLQMFHIDKYLSNQYFNRLQKVSTDKDIMLWAKIFAYLTSGMHKEAIEILLSHFSNDTKLINCYEKSYKSINDYKPISFNYIQRSAFKNIFYDQIAYSLNGQSKYSHQIMSEPASLQFIWVLLRTTGIYWHQKKDLFLKIRESVITNYNDCTSNSEIIRNMLFLLDYKAIINLGPNIIMNRDDYLHFLLVMSAYPKLLPDFNIENILIKNLTKYILELIFQKNEDYIYYISLIPSHKISQQISEIIISSDIITTLNWKLLKQTLKEQIFRNLVITTLNKYIFINRDYLKVAELANELLEDREVSLSFLMKMFVEHYDQKDNQKVEALKKAESFGLKLSSELKALDIKYDYLYKLISFFSELRQFYGHLSSRNETKIHEFILNSQFLFINIQENLTFFTKLQQLNGLQIYFKYIIKILNTVESSLIKKNNQDQLYKFKRIIKESFEKLVQLLQLYEKDMFYCKNFGKLNELVDEIY